MTESGSKPYQQVPIVECGEPIVPIPLTQFAIETPHPYVKVGAPYGDKSPYYLRVSVLERLLQAQHTLQAQRPGWRIQIFDAYRPIAVQQYMVDYAFKQAAAEQGWSIDHLSPTERQSLQAQVQQFWATPSHNPATPPPHSTGAAIDLTLVDENGNPINMGSPIDEMSDRSHPDFFATPQPGYSQSAESFLKDSEADRLLIHKNRQQLKQVMLKAGFRQHPNEWWHFSFGDQLWAWIVNQEQMICNQEQPISSQTPPILQVAKYGRAEQF
jgi:D-alanyl-D-alanine dipeptidase